MVLAEILKFAVANFFMLPNQTLGYILIKIKNIRKSSQLTPARTSMSSNEKFLILIVFNTYNIMETTTTTKKTCEVFTYIILLIANFLEFLAGVILC